MWAASLSAKKVPHKTKPPNGGLARIAASECVNLSLAIFRIATILRTKQAVFLSVLR